jgi:hypothetical protein
MIPSVSNVASSRWTVIYPDLIPFRIHSDHELFERPSPAMAVAFSFVFSITIHLYLLSWLIRLSS